MGLPPPHRVSLGRGVRARRGRGWILRSPCQHDRGLLVAVEVLAPTTQGGFSREITPLPGALRVRSQCSKTGQSVAGCADRTAGHANPPKRRMSHPEDQRQVLSSPPSAASILWQAFEQVNLSRSPRDAVTPAPADAVSLALVKLLRGII